MPLLYSRLSVMLALLIPALALLSATAGPVLFYTLALVAVVAIAHNAIKRFESARWRELMWISIAFGLPLISVLITALYTQSWSGSEFEKWLRCALGVPIAWLLLRVPRHWLQQVQWSFLFSAVAGSVMLVVIMHNPALGRGAVAEFGGKYIAVTFANLTLLFGLATLLTLPWTLTAWPRLERALKVGVALFSCYATWLSNTRSSWMLVIVLGLIVVVSYRYWSRASKYYVFLSGLVAVLCVGMVILAQGRDSRVSAAISDIKYYMADDAQRDTSLGIRLQLWHASWRMFLKHPVVGNGLNNFRHNLAELQKQGVVTPEVVKGFGEAHNDLVAAMAGYGIVGLLGMLALYGIPTGIFYRRLAASDAMTQVSAQLGLLVCLGYFCFSQTEMMFRNMRSIPIYVATVVVLMALSDSRRQPPLLHTLNPHPQS
jgi:O-antigen ligase